MKRRRKERKITELIPSVLLSFTDCRLGEILLRTREEKASSLLLSILQ